MEDLKYIKKHYGENFAHLCRGLFPTLLEKEGLLKELITKNFAPSRALYEELKSHKYELRTFIYRQAGLEYKRITKLGKSPEELMDEAGYILYPECEEQEDILAFKKYYAPFEEICTFKGERLNVCRVWFAVKKNVDEIKREEFREPRRDDEYGTSVISIQFTLGDNSSLSIKNRYNDFVENPDATFGNDLDNIIEGLTNAFVNKYEINLVSEGEKKIDLNNFILAQDGKYYCKTFDWLGVNYCDNNVIVEKDKLISYDKSKYILMENYVLDFNNKTIVPHGQEKDSFTESIGEIKNIVYKKNEDYNRVVEITPIKGKKVEITLDKRNRIIGYSNPNVTEIGRQFLFHNTKLRKLNLPKVTKIENEFLYHNIELKELSLPSLKEMGSKTLYLNKILSKVHLTNLEEMGDFNFYINMCLKEWITPKLKSMGKSNFYTNEDLEKIVMPNAEEVGKNNFYSNKNLKTINLDSINSLGEGFLNDNTEFSRSKFIKEEIEKE